MVHQEIQDHSEGSCGDIMDAVLIEFMMESMALYVREFFAGRMGTLSYFSKQCVGNALAYSEMFTRDKTEEWQEQWFPFDCTPAVPLSETVKIEEIIYNVGVNDRPQIPGEKDRRLLRFGRQEIIQPGALFRAILWGTLPMLEKRQNFFIGKKRGAAVIRDVKRAWNVKITDCPSGTIMPVQIRLDQLHIFSSYQPLVAMNRFLIVRVPAWGHDRWLNVDEYSVPVTPDQKRVEKMSR